MSLKAGYEEKKEPGYLEGEPVPLKEEPIFLKEEPLFLEEPLPLKVEPQLLKEEPIWDIAAADLYADHDIKDDVVVGPVMLQPPDAAFAISATETSCKQPTAPTKNATSKPGAQAHRCYICQRTFVDNSLLINHACVPQQVLDARTVPHTVHNLPITDQTNCGLDKHNKIRNYSVGEPNYCDICQKQFKHKSTLKLHRLTHSESFSCKLCNVKFKYENDLDAHYKDHVEFNNENAVDDVKAVHNRVRVCAGRQRVKDTALSGSSGNVASLQLPKWKILKQGAKPNSKKYLIVQPGSKTSTQLDISVLQQNLIQGSPKPNYNANTEQMEHQLHVGPSAYELGKNCPLQRNQNVQSDLLKPKKNPKSVVLNTNGPKLKDKKNVYMYCEVCEKQIKVKHNLIAHMRSHVRKKQKIPPPSNQDLQDQPSPKESPISPNDIVVNSYEPKLKQTKEKYMYCDVCKKQIKVKHNLNAHMQAHIRKKQKYCDICEKSFHSKKYLIKHKQRHTGEIFPCHLCGMTFMAERLLLIHKRIHIGEESFICDICQKVFKCKLKLISHLKYHLRPRDSGIKRLPCDICEKKFLNSASLSSHKFVHVAVREHSCGICKKQFHLRNRLMQHILYVHEGKKLFKCGTCQRAFQHRSNLNEHELLHGEKKLICRTCGNKFHRQAGLLSHNMRVHSEREPFICDVCQRQFKSKTALISHITTKHTEGHSNMSLTDYIKKCKSERPNRVKTNCSNS